jgi:GH25 family lysozyme M1 (1,4-beta-N-acetylmuramidase)
MVDVSACQGSAIDWPAVRAGGFLAAVVKVSEGRRGIDPKALQNLAGAEHAGLYRAVYAFAHVQEDPVEQAELFWAASGDTALTPVLDLETAPAGMSPIDVARAGLRIADAIEARFGRPPWLYSGENFLLTRVGPALSAIPALAVLFGRMPAWVARYASTTVPWAPTAASKPPMVPRGMRLLAWQYSGDAGFRVPGISVDCDRSIVFGGEPALRDALGLTPLA